MGGDSVTVVTMRPSTEVPDMDMEGSGNSDATTTMQPIMEDDPDQDIIPFPSNDSQDSTTASTTDQDQLSTTTSSTSEETTPSTEDDQESSATDDAESTTQAEATTETVDQSFLCTAMTVLMPVEISLCLANT